VIAGVDGYRDKWIVVVALQAGGTEVRGPMSFPDLYRDPNLDLIVIDIPIGLAEKGTRKADAEARGFLGKRACCVFKHRSGKSCTVIGVKLARSGSPSRKRNARSNRSLSFLKWLRLITFCDLTILR